MDLRKKWHYALLNYGIYLNLTETILNILDES
jgi:hypothetical protein